MKSFQEPAKHDPVMDRRTLLKAKGMTVFARIDHAAGAKQAGLELGPLMQANPVVGIDLPLKALVWLTYNDPHWITRRHGLGAAANAQADPMAAALAALAKHAAGG